jgi:segregation and condensation protein B
MTIDRTDADAEAKPRSSDRLSDATLDLVTEFRLAAWRRLRLPSAEQPLDIVSGQSEMNSEHPEIDSGYQEVDSEYQKIDSVYPEVDSEYPEVDSVYPKVDSEYSEIDSGYPKVDSEYSEVDPEYQEIDSGRPEVHSGDAEIVSEGSEQAPGSAEADARATGQVARAHLRGVLEALVFAADNPMSLGELVRASKAPRPLVKELMAELVVDYQARGFRLEEVAGGFAFRTSPAFAPFVREVSTKKPVRMTRAQLETLSIVAYRQPITRPEIDDVRGVDSGPVLKLLLERDLVRILGKRDEPGRPMLYGTTAQFLEFFGLKALADLPTLREFTELTDESRRTYERELGEEVPDAPVASSEGLPGSEAAFFSYKANPGDPEPVPEPDEDELEPAPPADDAPEPATEPEDDDDEVEDADEDEDEDDDEDDEDEGEDEDDEDDDDDDDDDEDDEDDDDDDDDDDEDDEDED